MADELVLIVDDDEANARLTRAVLAAAGFRTLEAGSGEEALALLVAHRPEVILMDLSLPDMHGTEVLVRVKEDAKTADIPVVALTALSAADEWFLAAGFDGHLEKPISIADFPHQVRRYCGPGRALRGQPPVEQ